MTTVKVLDLTKLPNTPVSEVAEMLGMDLGKDFAPFRAQMEQMSEYEFLDHYLRYHGIINWTGQIWLVVQCLLQAAESAREERRRNLNI